MTRIEKQFEFEAAVHFNGRFVINVFDLGLSMLVETNSAREQNVAIDRINYFLGRVITDCIFVYEKDSEAIAKYKAAGIKVCAVPEEPFDQVIGALLLLKMNAIMEGRLVITDIVLGSKMTDGIKFNIIVEEAESAFLNPKRWWTQPNPMINDIVLEDTNILNLFDLGDWSKLDLNWKEKAEKNPK